MKSGNSTPRAKRSVALSVILGTLLVPISAYAASALFDAGDVAESAIAAESSPPAETAVADPPTVAADLGTACGEAGLAMVATETAGTITELQQAALDALRGICTEQGIPLPASQPEPAVTSVTQLSPPPSAPATEQVAVASDDDDHGRHGGDDEDDHHGGGEDNDDHDGRHGDDDDDRHGEDHD
jgi:hypothetical protein